MKTIPTRSQAMDKYQIAQGVYHSSEKALDSLTDLERFMLLSEPPYFFKRLIFRFELRALLNRGLKTMEDSRKFTSFLRKHILPGKISIASITLSDAIISWHD
jgi:hypothetical protein